MKKVYLAGRFEDKDRLTVEAARLNAIGYRVISAWLLEQPLQRTGANDIATGTGEVTEAQAQYYALRDLAEIKEADIFVVDTQEVNVRAGREVEFGLALTRMIPRYIVGPARNVFHQLATRRFTSWEELHEFFAIGHN